MRHIIGFFAALLISALGTAAMPLTPSVSHQAEFFPHQEAVIAKPTSAHFAARAPPLAVLGVAFAGYLTVMRGSAFGLHGLETVAALFGFSGGFNAPNRTSIETSNGALVRPVDSPNYSVATEVQLPSDAYPGVSRRRHNQISNQALHEAFEANPTYAAQMENLYPGIVDGVRPGPRGAFPRDAPTPDVTWHHGTTPGQMQLVPFDQHTAPGPVQGSLHPGPNSGCGFADWGTECLSQL